MILPQIFPCHVSVQLLSGEDSGFRLSSCGPVEAPVVRVKPHHAAPAPLQGGAKPVANSEPSQLHATLLRRIMNHTFIP